MLFALGLFALMVLVALAERLEKWWARAGRAGDTPAAPTPLAASLDDPRAEPDPRAAIIRAYGRFERALAAARAPARAVADAGRVHARPTLARLPVPAAPVRRLTALFELARFSDRPLGAEARDAACDSLDAITHRARRRGRARAR